MSADNKVTKNYVSLLPPEYLKRRREAGLARRITVTLAAVAAAFALLTCITFLFRYAGSMSAKTIAEENEKVRREIGQIDHYEQRHAALRGLRDRIVAVQKQDSMWLYAVSDVIAALPNSVSLAGVETSISEDGARVCILQCEGASYEDISYSIGEIGGILQIKSVDCTDSRGDAGYVRFTLDVTFEPVKEEQEP